MLVCNFVQIAIECISSVGKIFHLFGIALFESGYLAPVLPRCLTPLACSSLAALVGRSLAALLACTAALVWRSLAALLACRQLLAQRRPRTPHSWVIRDVLMMPGLRQSSSTRWHSSLLQPETKQYLSVMHTCSLKLWLVAWKHAILDDCLKPRC